MIFMFQIPKKIKIKKSWWKVKFTDELSNKYKKELKGFHGLTWFRLKEIHLCNEQSQRQAASTFLHELLHACSNDAISERAEEKFIRDVEPNLLKVLSQLKWRK